MRPIRVGRWSSLLLAAGVVVVLALIWASPAGAQLQVQSKDGKASIKFGFLAQARAEFLDTANADKTSQNLFFRRLRLLAGGKLNDKWSFFFETDSPNLGKESGGQKGTSDIFFQDFVISYNHSDAFHLDIGELLMENTYNRNQSATSLMATDYGQFTFVNSGPLDERVGRDYGIRARGYLGAKHLEYRVGVYQGRRVPGATNPLRTMGRLTYNFFDPQVGYFYQGTSLGKKHIVSIGGSYDRQGDYDAVGADFYVDQPLKGGNGFTFQVDWASYDGGTFLTTLPKQDDLFAELGFYAAKSKLLPFVQYSSQNFDNPLLADNEKLQVGLGFMFGGHHQNIKLSWAQLSKDGAPDRNEVWVNFQAFTF